VSIIVSIIVKNKGINTMEIPAAYLQQIDVFLPHAATKAMRLNRDGLVNEVVIVDDQWSFRFPNNEEGKVALHKESQLLEVVQPHLSLPTPRFQWLSDDCVVYEFIPGQPLDRNTLLCQDERTQTKVAEQLAAFLHELHTIPLDALSQLALEAPTQPTVTGWREKFAEIERDLFPYLWANQKQWVTDLFAPLLDGRVDMRFQTALIHNDLASYHILFDPVAGRINGVIDFGVARLGDPAGDISALLNNVGEEFLYPMRAAYPGLDAMLDRARFKASYIELWWLQQGLRTHDISWYMVHIGRARPMMPVGWGKEG